MLEIEAGDSVLEVRLPTVQHHIERLDIFLYLGLVLHPSNHPLQFFPSRGLVPVELLYFVQVLLLPHRPLDHQHLVAVLEVAQLPLDLVEKTRNDCPLAPQRPNCVHLLRQLIGGSVGLFANLLKVLLASEQGIGKLLKLISLLVVP